MHKAEWAMARSCMWVAVCDQGGWRAAEEARARLWQGSHIRATQVQVCGSGSLAVEQFLLVASGREILVVRGGYEGGLVVEMVSLCDLQ